MSRSVPSFRFVLSSARCAVAPWAGCCVSVRVRPSRRSLSGWVAVVRFSSPAAANRFAALWGSRLPVWCRGCVVRPLPVCVSLGRDYDYAVSVPFVRFLSGGV